MQLLSIRPNLARGHAAAAADGVVATVRLGHVPSGLVKYMAAAPTDRRYAFSGSGLPYAGASQALEGGAAYRGQVEAQADGVVEIPLPNGVPNAYYIRLGSVKVPPTLHVEYASAEGARYMGAVQLANAVPFRSLTYPLQRRDASFYDQEATQVRSQEQILYDSAYPRLDQEPADFWGARPAR
jgi:hypothetical protein